METIPAAFELPGTHSLSQYEMEYEMKYEIVLELKKVVLVLVLFL